jgi:hypothetical protein
MKNSFAAAAILLFVLASQTFAADVVKARVTYAGLYNDGNAFIGLDKTIQQAGCPAARFDLPDAAPTFGEGAPLSKELLRIAFTALTSGKTVTVRTNGCSNGFPTITGDKNILHSAFFYIDDLP